MQHIFVYIVKYEALKDGKNKYINIKMTGLFSDLMRKISIGEKTEEANTGLEVNGSLD